MEVEQFQPEFLKRLFFKFSFHYLELKRLGWMERFFENVKRVRDAGVSFTVEITPSDELVPYIDEIKQVCMEHLGTYCHITIARSIKRYGALSIRICFLLRNQFFIKGGRNFVMRVNGVYM